MLACMFVSLTIPTYVKTQKFEISDCLCTRSLDYIQA